MENDRHVGGVEEFDGIGLNCSSDSFILEGDVNLETLEIDDDDENEGGRDETRQVWQMGAVECVLKSMQLVINHEETME